MTEAGPGAPKYLRLADEIRRRIRSGQYPVGERLPTESALVAKFGFSPPTVRQALTVLRSEGLIETRHGIGTFVRDNRRLQRRSRRRYGRARADEQLLTSGLDHEIISAEREAPPEDVAEHIGTNPVVVRRRRLRDTGGRVVELGASYVPVDIAGGTFLEELTVVPKALFLCVEDLSGKRYTHARDHWVARMPTPREADELNIPTGTPVLHVLHVATAEDGTVLEVSESTWPADAVMLIDDYPITQDPEELEAASDV